MCSFSKETVYFQQQEREKQEKEKFSQKDVFVTQNVNIWGTASQSLSWSNPTVPQSWSISPGSGGGFWEEPVSKAGNPPPLQKLPMMQKATIVPSSKQTAQPPQLSPQQQQQNNKSGKSKSKKEEELVKKLFEQNTAKTDDFTQWCAKALSGLQVSVDSQYHFSLMCFFRKIFCFNLYLFYFKKLPCKLHFTSLQN